MSLSSHHEHEFSLTVIGIGFAFHIDHASDHSLGLFSHTNASDQLDNHSIHK